jgi:hypothetical protein
MNHEDESVREQLAEGLYETLHYANEKTRDAVLAELRDLNRMSPRDGAVRQLLAMALNNSLVDAKGDAAPKRRDDLLEELRALSRMFPEDLSVRLRLALALFNTHHYADQEQLKRREALLDELRGLGPLYPNGALIQKILDLVGHE